jgi:hypothetical protein
MLATVCWMFKFHGWRMSKIEYWICGLMLTATQVTGLSAFAGPHAPERASLAPPKNDPFVGFSPVFKAVATVKPPKSRPVQAPELAPLAVATPQVPPLDLQYVGRLTIGESAPQVYVMHQSQWLVLEKDTTLHNGYVVEAVEAQRVKLRYPALNVSKQFLLPPLPKVETR